ncbi:FAD-binding protein [uncultured virus]|nr:FAD-binding protein [uncultured virus]
MICIVGASIAGLTLAQYLKKHNIAFIILENKQSRISDDKGDDQRSCQNQGYSLTLMQAVGILKELNLFDDLTDTVITTKSYGFSSEGTPLWCRDSWSDKTIVRRSELLRVLKQGIFVTYFDYDHYECHDDHVIVYDRRSCCGSQSYDKEGNSINCDYLIGCDGLHSKVRTQLIGPNYIESCEDLILINGITSSTKITKSSIEVDGSYQYVDGVSRLFVKPFDHSHVMWQLSFPKILLSETSGGMSEIVSSTEIAKSIVSNWSVIAKEFISTSDCVAARHLWQTTDILSLPRGRVTLLGDSAHTMSPFKGLGANTAMMDARNFVNCIVGSADMVESIQKYNIIMLERGNRNRLNSALNTKFSHSKAVLKTR